MCGKEFTETYSYTLPTKAWLCLRINEGNLSTKCYYLPFLCSLENKRTSEMPAWNSMASFLPSQYLSWFLLITILQMSHCGSPQMIAIIIHFPLKRSWILKRVRLLLPSEKTGWQMVSFWRFKGQKSEFVSSEVVRWRGRNGEGQGLWAFRSRWERASQESCHFPSVFIQYFFTYRRERVLHPGKLLSLSEYETQFQQSDQSVPFWAIIAHFKGAL